MSDFMMHFYDFPIKIDINQATNDEKIFKTYLNIILIVCAGHQFGDHFSILIK